MSVSPQPGQCVANPVSYGMGAVSSASIPINQAGDYHIGENVTFSFNSCSTQLTSVFDQSVISDGASSFMSTQSIGTPKSDSKFRVYNALTATPLVRTISPQSNPTISTLILGIKEIHAGNTFAGDPTQLLFRSKSHSSRKSKQENELAYTESQKNLLKVGTTGDMRLIWAASVGDVINVLALTHLVRLRSSKGMTALMAAACSDHEECVSVLYQHEHRLQANNGMTALMCAAAKGSIKSIPLLATTEIRMSDKNKRTALMHAAQHNQHECVKLLLKESMLVDASGNTALIIAATLGHLHCVRYLVTKEAGLRLPSGLTALMIAAHKKDAATASTLLMECKIRDEKGKTALMYAAEAGSDECVELLIAHESGMQDLKGNTALIYAAKAGSFDCVELLASFESRTANSSGYSALMMAVCANATDCVEVLCTTESGIRDKNGRTALILAVLSSNCNEDIVRLLLDEAGVLDNLGNCALVYAIHKKNERAVQLLVPRESRLQNPKGYTALMISALLSRGELAEYLLDGIGLTTNDGYCALYFAIDTYDRYAINMLLPYESHLLAITSDMRAALCGDVSSLAWSPTRDISQRDRFGRSVLMYAILGDQYKCAELSASNKVAPDKNGWTALMYAAKKGHTKYINLLLHPNIKAKNRAGDTAVDIARKAGHIEFLNTITYYI